MSLELYRILEFDRPVPLSELKHRYKELAKRYHPDLNKASDAEDRFKLISNAYQLLLTITPPETKVVKKKINTNVEHKIFRVLDGKSKHHTIKYPAETILRNTMFYFMLGFNEYSAFTEDEIRLPANITLRTNTLVLQIKVEYGF